MVKLCRCRQLLSFASRPGLRRRRYSSPPPPPPPARMLALTTVACHDCDPSSPKSHTPYIHDRMHILPAGQGQRQSRPGSTRKPSLSSHPVPDSAPGSRRSTRQSEYGGYPSIAPAEGLRAKRGTTDHAACPALPAAESQRSQWESSDHAAYPTVPSSDRRHSRRQTADQPTDGRTSPGYAPYPSVASPEDRHRSGSYHEQSKRVTQQQGAAGEPPAEGRRSRRATDDGTEDVRIDSTARPTRVSHNGSEGAHAQHAALSGTRERWGADAAVTLSYPNAGETLPALHISLWQDIGYPLTWDHSPRLLGGIGGAINRMHALLSVYQPCMQQHPDVPGISNGVFALMMASDTEQLIPCLLSWPPADAAHRRTDSSAPPRQQTWPGVEESSPSEEEWRKQAAPTYSAYPWNDAEVAELGKAGGLGMLGHKFHRKTTVNWYTSTAKYWCLVSEDQLSEHTLCKSHQ